MGRLLLLKCFAVASPNGKKKTTRYLNWTLLIFDQKINFSHPLKFPQLRVATHLPQIGLRAHAKKSQNKAFKV
jgi:hypothetical protein